MRLSTSLAVDAHAAGRAQRGAMVCHRRLDPKPMVICAFQLGAEPFSAAAIGWGRDTKRMSLEVAGDPRNRTLLFAMLLPFAREFNGYFERPYDEDHEIITRRNGEQQQIANTIPQIVVPNRDTALLLGRLGRRLAYLSTDGDWPADPEVVRLGRHLMWIREHAARYGQQVMISLTDVLTSHWVFALNDWESQSLAALDAFIDPPAGMHGHTAASAADRVPLGPRPDADLDRRLAPLLDTFNKKRSGDTDSKIVEPLLAPIREHYAPLLERAWRLTWDGIERECAHDEARFVEARYGEDCRRYSQHMAWVHQAGGIRRTRHTIRQAIARISDLESEQTSVVAQEYCDDPLKMVDLLASGEAMIGTVIGLDDQHQIQGPKRMVTRPLLKLRLDEPCPVLPGDIVHWDLVPDKDFEVINIDRADDGRDELTLLLHNPGLKELPEVGEGACFTLLSTVSRWNAYPPKEVPWPHRGSDTRSAAEPIETSEEMIA